MRKGPWIFVAFAAALPAPAPATAGLCDDLRVAIRSVHDAPALSSMTGTSPPPGFALFQYCRDNRHDFTTELVCGWRLSPGAPTVEDLAGEVLSCLPGASRRDDPRAAMSGEAMLNFDVFVILIARERNASGDNARITLSIPEG